jgi:hypothetical protein
MGRKDSQCFGTEVLFSRKPAEGAFTNTRYSNLGIPSISSTGVAA